MRRRDILKAVAAAPVMAVAGPGCRTARPTPREPSGPAFRVMTWNLNYGLTGDRGMVQTLGEADVDLVLLQEITPGWARALRALSGPFPHQAHHPDDHAGGLSVLSRYPLVFDELVPGPSWFPAQQTVAQVPGGDVQLLNVHLRPPFSDGGSVVLGYFSTPGVRDAEIDHFVHELDPRIPTVIAGDFNEASGPASDRLYGYGYRSALADFAPEETTWRWEVPVLGEVRQTLDHIWVDARLTAVDAWVERTGRSDHFPVVAWLEQHV